MQRGRYPDKWAKSKYNTRLPFTAPYSNAADAGEDIPNMPPVPEEQPTAEETPAPTEQPMAEQTPVAQEQPTVEQTPVAQEQPTVEQTPVAQEQPAEEETPAPAEQPAAEEQPAAQEQPAAEETPMAQEPAKPEEQRPTRVAVAAATQRQTQQEAEFICGKNAVLAALRAEQSINRVLLAEGLNSAFAAEIIKCCKGQGIAYQYAPKAKLAAIAGPEHRGVICELAAFNYADIDDMLANAESRGEHPLLLLLDGVEDPHNLGAVIRTALCVGAHGVIIPKRRSAALNATVAKTSAGASAYMPVARVANLNQTCRALKEAGLWLAAADMDGQTAWKASLSGPLALVLGGEDKGVSPLLKASCDFCISLPMSGNLGSLNVSAAASALLYEIRRQRDIL